MTSINEPCPFCGAGDDMLEWSGNFGRRSISCISCGATGPVNRTIARAWAGWNERRGESYSSPSGITASAPQAPAPPKPRR